MPRQPSIGGKQRLGKTSKMGQRDIQRLLITGAMAGIRWATRRGSPKGGGGRGGAGEQDGVRHLGGSDSERGLSWLGAEIRAMRMSR
ncbi:MAG: hypothetical protein ACOCXA_00975 [Planctomycetota bacterium]